MKLPLFSIIVPVYNAEKTLDRCIKSILMQSYTDFELILVNDGSEDNSALICEKYANIDSRIVLHHKHNGGVSSARNLGLSIARGIWVTFCDSDDWVLENWLNNFICNITGVDLICQGMNCDYSNWRHEGQIRHVLGVDYQGDIRGLLYELHKGKIVGYTVIKCFRNNLLQERGMRFNENYNCYEDEEFVLRYLTYCNSAYATSNAGYIYMCPDFERKYVQKSNLLDLHSSLYNSALNIYNQQINKVTYHYLESYTMCLIMSFGVEPKWTYLRRYRKDVHKLVMLTKMFLPTKLLIWLDPTSCLSYIVLKLHYRFRMIFNKKS